MSTKLASSVTTGSILQSARKANDGVKSSYEKLSSGQRITSAKDDASGISIATKQRAEVASLGQTLRSLNDGVSMAQVAEGNMDTVSKQLVRLRELSIQSASDTFGESERAMLDTEYQALLSEIARSSKAAELNGVKLLDGNLEGFTVHIGTDSSKSSKLEIKNQLHVQSVEALGVSGSHVSSKIGAVKSIDMIDYAINEVASARSFWGSLQSRMQNSINVNQSKSINTDQARSRIEDVDFALETAKIAKSKMIAEASMSALSQSNVSQNNLLKLLK